MKGPRPSTQAIALVAEMGCELLDQERPTLARRTGEPLDGGFEVWAPPGFSFEASGCHTLCVPWPYGMPIDEAWGRLLSELQRGLQPCKPGCELCAEVQA